MFVHAVSGCDIVSVPDMKDQKRALEVLPIYGDHDSLSTFTEPRSMPENILQMSEQGSS